MDLRLLKYFVAVYEEKNITRAAERCYVSQPSLSNALKQLEDEVGKPLFVRHKKGVTVADEAHYLYPRARRLLEDAETLTDLFKNPQAFKPLSLGVFPDLSPKRLADVLALVRENISGLALRVVDYDEEADARITLDVLKGPDEIFLPLWEEEYVVCLRPDHPLAHHSELLPEDLDKYDFIECPPCEAHQQTAGLLACSGLRMNIVASAEHKGQVMHLVQAGYGISFLPDGVLEMAHDLVSIPFRGPRMFRRIGITYPAEQSLEPALAEVVTLFGSKPE